MIEARIKTVYYSSKANRNFMTKYACAKNEAKFLIMEKYETEQGCIRGCGCGWNEQCDQGYYAPRDLENYDEIHRRLYKRILNKLKGGEK